MKKTLLEYHYEFRIESLREDPNVNYAKRLLTIELLAKELGWKHMCERESIDIRMQNFCNA